MAASFDPNTTPLSPNPNGDPPNFDNPASLAPTVLGTGLMLIILSSACVTTRVFNSFKIQHRLDVGDYLIIFGLLGSIAYWAIIYSLAYDGLGRHTWDVPISFINRSFVDRQFAAQILSSPVRLAITSAIILLYLKIFGILKWVRITCYTLGVFVFLIQAMNVAIAIQWYAPRPGEGQLYVFNALARSGITGASAIVNAACSVAVDIGLFLIPFFVVPTLKISQERKRALYVVFLFGALIIVSGCVGIAYKTYGVQGRMGDPFWVGMIAIITVYCEQFALIIVACVPAMSSFYLTTVSRSRFFSSVHDSMKRFKGYSRTRTSRTNSSDHSGSGLPQMTTRNASGTSHSTKTFTASPGVVIRTSDEELKLPAKIAQQHV